MKPLLLIILGLFLLSGSCKKKEPEGPALPPITQEGKNTFGCKVNGLIYVTEGRLEGNNTSPRGVRYDGMHSDSSIEFQALCNIPEDVNLHFSCLYKEGQKNFPIGDYARDWAQVTMPVENDDLAKSTFGTDKDHVGTIRINYFQSGVLAGTFEFDAIDDKGRVIHVTDGRFDISTK